MKFSQVIGQEAIKQHLLAQVAEGHIPHAQLFFGAEGSGKFAMALAYASYLLCQNPSANDSCGECPSCQMLAKLAHPDLHFVYPTIRQKLSTDFIGEWRNMVKASPYFSMETWLKEIKAENQQPVIYTKEAMQINYQIALQSALGGYKIIIIWQPERLKNEAANKLLKSLEEPPAETVIILVSDEPERILPTIVSRTQRIEFPALPQDVVQENLTKQAGLSADDARRVARFAQGNYLRALESIQVDRDSDLFLDMFVKLMRLAYVKKVRELQEWSDAVSKWGRERQANFLDFCQRLVRENFIFNYKHPELNFMSPKENDFSKNFARFVNERNVISISNELQQAARDIKGNVNAKMVFFDFALKTIVLIHK